MRVLAFELLLASSALAFPLMKRKNVVPSTCDPAVVKTVLDTLNSMNAPEIVQLATFETALVSYSLSYPSIILFLITQPIYRSSHASIT
jgi:hypothetical protein